MSNKKLTDRDEWKALQSHYDQIAGKHMRNLFADDPQRFEKLHLQLDGVLFDYSKNLITEETLNLFIDLAKACSVEPRRDQMFAGEKINESEDRAVLHTALRGSADENLEVDDENINEYVQKTLLQIKKISNQIRSEKKITDVVNIGIGGSDLGANMVYEALKDYADGPAVHFVSNIDGAHISETLEKLSPKTTVFIIASKTFTTLETLANAQTAKNWLIESLGDDSIEDHFIAVTSNTKKAKEIGVTADNILELRDWIGGRYSLWSAIGLPIAIAASFESFQKFLNGARAMDEHFKTAPLAQNIPVIMAMLGIWHRNFHNFGALAILPYAQNLDKFPAYIQQLEMESNGKNTDRNGEALNYATSPVIFGEPGTNSQHAFFQLLHQGTDIIPADFIVTINPDHGLPDHQTKLMANALAQTQALMEGNSENKQPYQKFYGNRPSSTLILEHLDPYNLGMLLALYEHKIFVQGVIWDINSFDQWGVELGKILAKNITQNLENGSKVKGIDKYTQALIQHIKTHKT